MRRAACLLLASALAGLAPSPAAADCPARDLTAIAAIKGSKPSVPAGETVTVRGVVTGDYRGGQRLGGFYMQSPSPGDRLPSGVFVYAPDSEPGSEPVATGREVAVTALTDLFHGRRQLHRVERIMDCGKVGLPDPVTLPMPEAERGPYRPYEGLYVALNRPMTVSGNRDLARYGSLLLSAGGRLMKPGNAPGDPPVPNAARRLVLDDASYERDPRPVPWLDADGTRRTGSVVEGLRGVLTRAFRAWRLHPLSPAEVRFVDANPRRAELPAAEGPRAAAFNVENYFTTLGKRGAASRAGLAAQRRRLEAVAAGLDADLLALAEVENGPAAVADLASRLGEATGIDGGYRTFGLDRPLGGDAIRVMLAWDPGRVTLLEGPFIDDAPVHRRPPLAGLFRLRPDGPGTLVVAIHHKSKGDCPPSGDVDRGQGCWNRLRVRQSRALTEFVAERREALDTNRVLVLGDVNAYGAEDPVRVLRESGLTDLVRVHLPPAARYTYVHRGEAGYLDTALASAPLADDVAGLRVWHVNADEPPALHRISPDTEGPWRSSDHDPVVVDLAAAQK